MKIFFLDTNILWWYFVKDSKNHPSTKKVSAMPYLFTFTKWPSDKTAEVVKKVSEGVNKFILGNTYLYDCINIIEH